MFAVRIMRLEFRDYPSEVELEGVIEKEISKKRIPIDMVRSISVSGGAGQTTFAYVTYKGRKREEGEK